jgi:hypothetical protein
VGETRPPRRRLKKSKPTERAVIGLVRKVIDPDTGEEIKAIVGYTPMDKRLMQEMQLRVGDIVVMDIFKERNRRFWGLWHKLAEFVADNTEEYNGLRQHDMLKQLQLDARVHCELRDFTLEDGSTLRAWQPKSLNFFDTDETEAQAIWMQLCGYVARRFFFEWTPEQVAEAAEFWENKT